nr:family 10 glycosylhydrolase [Chloroflexia bacterium]
ARGNPRTHQHAIAAITWDDFEVVPRLAHDLGLKAQLYVSVLDEGRPLPPRRERERSFHNAMHGQHVTWQTTWSREHPECNVVDRRGTGRQWGVLCYGYPEVRALMRDRIARLVAGYDFDGVFLCLRTQARPAEFADQFGFNEPVRRDFCERTGRDILREDFDLQAWRNLQASYFTRFLREVREILRPTGKTLSIGVPPGDIVGPPIGNWAIEWRTWVADGLIDELVVDQNSSQCPSMWHQLWPMHRGYGYLQNGLDDLHLPPLAEALTRDYGPALSGRGVRLSVARQWRERSAAEEAALLAQPVVSGLVFSTFRHDNPGAIARGTFVA